MWFALPMPAMCNGAIVGEQASIVPRYHAKPMNHWHFEGEVDRHDTTAQAAPR